MPNLFTLWGRIRDYITLGLLAGAVVAGVGWYTTDLKLDTCRANRIADRATYESAQHEYEAKALREKLEIEERNRERAEEADASYRSLLEQYNAVLMRRFAAPRSTDSGTDLPGTAPTSEGVDGPSEGPVIPEITIPFEDAEICAENTARLEVARKWALEN